MSKIKLETSRNAKIVLEEIIEEKKIDEIVIPGIATIEKTTEQKEEVILTEEERKIYNIIMEIISEKSEKLNNSDIEILNILSKDDYSLRLRKNIYSINKFNLICYDLKNNLLDKMTMDNKKEIFEVFTYVIDLYGKSQQEEYISIIEDFTESEKKVISSIYDTYITEFSNMSESEKEQIDTYDVELNLDLEVSELYTNLFGRNSDIPPKIIYYLLLKKFQKVYTEYRYDKENEYELLNISDTEEEFKRIFKEKQNIIRKLIKKITEYNFYNKAEEEIENTPIEEAELFDVKNGIIFLEIDDLEKDRQNVLKNGMDSLKAVNRTLRKIMTKSIVDLRMSHNKKVKTGKKDKDIVSYDDEFTLRRVDSGFGRVVYLVLPLSEENRKILSKNNYISEDGNIMLIFGVGSKEGGNSPVYDDSNKRLSNNIVEVRKIASIFYNNFDESTLKKAITLLEESKDAMKTLETSPTTKLRRS